VTLESIDRRCEKGILGLVLAILVFGPLATGAVRTPDFLVIQGLLIGVLLLWSVRLWVNPRRRLLWTPMCWAVVAFAAYAIVRYRTAEIEYVARMEMIRVLVYAFLFLAVLNNLHSQEHIRLIVFTLIFLAMAISFYAVYQYVANSDKVWMFVKPYPHRGSGTYISPDHLAGFLEMILPLGLAWLLVSRASTLIKVFIGYAALSILAGIVVTVSRGAWFSVALTLVVFFSLLFLHHTYRLPSAVLLVVLIGAGIYFIPGTHFFEQRLTQLVEGGGINNAVRLELWRCAVQLWHRNPWWGIGPDHFNQLFPTCRPEFIQLQPDRVHNDYLNTLVDWGVAGTSLVAAAWVLLYAGVFKSWRFVRGSPSDLGSKKSNKFATVLGASLGLFAILCHSTVDFNMHIPANAILAVTLMALLTSYLRFASDRYWISLRAVPRVLATLALLSGSAYLGREGVRRWQEYTLLSRADRLETYSPEQLSLLEQAFAVDPMNYETAYSIGESLRTQSWEGSDDYTAWATQAIGWFDRAAALNPYCSDAFMRRGMCLDWLGKFDQGRASFDHAVQLDPNGYFTAAHMGWHFVQTRNYAAAKEWFERSHRLQSQNNPIADSYMAIVDQKLLEAAGDSPPPKP
jgi:O-antigen ligase